MDEYVKIRINNTYEKELKEGEKNKRKQDGRKEGRKM